jgi:hypothetical protein
LKYLGLHGPVDILCHEQSGYFEEKLFGGDLGVEGEFASVGEVLEEVKAEEEDFFILYAEALGDAIDGVLGHVDA